MVSYRISEWGSEGETGTGTVTSIPTPRWDPWSPVPSDETLVPISSYSFIRNGDVWPTWKLYQVVTHPSVDGLEHLCQYSQRSKLCQQVGFRHFHARNTALTVIHSWNLGH
jgi:hypothetical protein